MLEVDEDSRLGREMLAGGARYHADLVPSDDAIARMYETAIEQLESAGLRQYEISNFARPGFQSRHNLRYWQTAAVSGARAWMLRRLCARCRAVESTKRVRYVLRSTTTDDLKAYLARAASRWRPRGSRLSGSTKRHGFWACG